MEDIYFGQWQTVWKKSAHASANAQVNESEGLLLGRTSLKTVANTV